MKIPSGNRAINCHLSLQLTRTLGLVFGNSCGTRVRGLNTQHALVLSPALWTPCPEPPEQPEGWSAPVCAPPQGPRLWGDRDRAGTVEKSLSKPYQK